MQNPSSSKKAVCQLCRTPYRVKISFLVEFYRVVVRGISLLSIAPLALVSAEIIPRLPLKASRQVDMLGFDVYAWTPRAFGWALSASDLNNISFVIKNREGVLGLLEDWSWPSLRPVLALGLAKLGSLGVLVQFFLTNFSEGGGAIVGGGLLTSFIQRFSPGQAMLMHYILSCLALRCCQTPRNKLGAAVYVLMCSSGVLYLARVVENVLRRMVLKVWPDLEVAQLAG
jgi:hypothetical protein